MTRIPIVLPKIGLTMEEGEVVAWLKAPGEHVVEGEAILELETEKVTTEILAPTSGILVEHCAHPGAVVAVGEPLGFVEPAPA